MDSELNIYDQKLVISFKFLHENFMKHHFLVIY